MEVLMQTSAMELRSGSKYRRGRENSSAASLGSMFWLQRLTNLYFDSDMPVANVVWPASLQQLTFGWGFNQPIVNVVWPASLQQLSFRREFNQPIVNVVWPASLQKLSFGGRFNQPIAEVV
ncbi:unnamed protein product [Ectocarpus fasciculatus]